MVKCMIVDDEPLAQQVIAKYLSQTPGLELTATCFTAVEAFSILHQQQINLIFLDIRMPVVSGIDFIRSLKNPPKFIFTTAYSEFAVTGFELEAVDYLLKPITFERFTRSIQRYLQQVAEPPALVKEYFYIKVNGELVKLNFSDILYVQSMKDYLKIITGTRSYLTHLTMQKLMELLPGNFKRVHRSYTVNKDKLDLISREYVKIGSFKIPVGQKFRSEIITYDGNDPSGQ